MKTIRYWLVAITLVAATTLVGAGAAPQQAPAPATAQSLRTFSSTPIDVDYQAASLRTVLRQLAEIGGVNLIIDPSVDPQAVIDLKLTQVPWYQVMEIVLRSGKLSSQLDGTVVRVLTRDREKEELKDAFEVRVANEQAPELQTIRLRLNYAVAKDIAQLLGTLGFGRRQSASGTTTGGGGSVQAEERTNMLVVQETPKNIEEIKAIVADLDKPEPQVEIEARIVQTTNTGQTQLGLNWGLNGQAVPALGNTTGLAFPNSAVLAGTINPGGIQAPKSDSQDQRQNAMSLALGAINGAFNLDVTLRALEQQGVAKVISRPHITTQNNKEAEVTQGFEIPYQVVTTAGGTATTSIQFKDAALKLLVTPKITSANTVIMNIQLENGSPSQLFGSEAGPSIATDRARTEVQVADGATTVIGGIVSSNDQYTNQRTPGVSRIPLLGWLFKNNTSDTTSQELLIFITPRIIRG
ncbi:MAG TPA: type IV pilus secretin PilQ [Vicinamibacterales bacterium]|jgi:type IV pilus assembly protein PilQ|nr:type IV pilus secretin PilQ [Vicinamibacterales bacterium]